MGEEEAHESKDKSAVFSNGDEARFLPNSKILLGVAVCILAWLMKVHASWVLTGQTAKIIGTILGRSIGGPTQTDTSARGWRVQVRSYSPKKKKKKKKCPLHGNLLIMNQAMNINTTYRSVFPSQLLPSIAAIALAASSFRTYVM